jgi:hypothetical protein
VCSGTHDPDRRRNRRDIPALPFCHVQLRGQIQKRHSADYPHVLNTLGDHLQKRRLRSRPAVEGSRRPAGDGGNARCLLANRTKPAGFEILAGHHSIPGIRPEAFRGNDRAGLDATPRRLGNVAEGVGNVAQGRPEHSGTLGTGGADSDRSISATSQGTPRDMTNRLRIGVRLVNITR